MTDQSYAKREKRWLLTIFIAYCIVLFAVLIDRFLVYYLISGDPYFNPIRLPRQYNLIPFHTIKPNGRGVNLWNVLMFVPLGIYMRIYAKKRVWKSILLCFVISIGVEGIQFALATGSLDVDDIILNMLGGLLGVGIYQLIKVISKGNIQTTNRVVATTALIFPPFLLAFIRHLVGFQFIWPDMIIHVVYFIILYPFIRGAAKWQYIYIIVGTIAFGIYFYGGFFTKLILM